jgi:hypothetical protein
VSRTGALGEAGPPPMADSNAIETASGEGGRAALSPGSPSSVTGPDSPGVPGEESLADLVHRLRTPLNAALLWVRLVRQGGLDPHSVQRALETIEQNLCLQNRLLGDLVAEAESGDTAGGTQPTCGPGAG